MPDAKKPQRPGKAAGTVGAAIVGHDPFGPDALGAEPAQGAKEKAGGGRLALVGQHLDIGQSGRVIHRDMDEVSARASVAPAPVAGDAMAGLVEAAQFPDIKVDKLARPLA